ncbi:MAG: hypothetical protein ACRDCW_18220 [Sarcina sp.]
MFGDLDGRTARSIRGTIIFLLLISIGGNFLFFIDKYKSLEIINFYYYRNFLKFMIVLFIIAISTGVEVNNNLSKEEKAKYRKNIIYYIIGAIIVLLIGFIENKLIQSTYMIFGNVINAGLFIVLYSASRNVWIITIEQDKKVNKHFATSQSYDYKVEPVWKWKIWFNPIVKVNTRDKRVKSKSGGMIMFCTIVGIVVGIGTVPRLIFILIFSFATIFVVEEVLNLNTVLTGVCTGIRKCRDEDGGGIYNIIRITDFKNKRECEIGYNQEFIPYREGDKLEVVMSLITRRKKLIRYIK